MATHGTLRVAHHLSPRGLSRGSNTGSVRKPKLACSSSESAHTRKFGFSKGVQTYFCNDCHTKFTGTDTLAHGRVSPSFIANALREYLCGMSYHEIERNIDEQTDTDISHTAVMKWVQHDTSEAIRQTKDLHPKVGGTWIADEASYIKTDVKTKDPKGVLFWDIMSTDAGFLLASRMTTSPESSRTPEHSWSWPRSRAGKTPKDVVTDKLASYIDGIELAYGGDAKHRQGGPFDLEDSTSLIERFHNTLKDRTKVMRDLRDKNTLKRFTDGWLVHYNFYKPHMALDDKPPAEVAGLQYENHSWADVVGYKKAPLVQTLKPNTESA